MNFKDGSVLVDMSGVDLGVDLADSFEGEGEEEIVEVRDVLRITSKTYQEDTAGKIKAISLAGIGPRINLRNIHFFSSLVILNLSNLLFYKTGGEVLKGIKLD